MAQAGMAFIIGLGLLLGGCGPRLQGVVKTPGYDESVRGAVVVLMAGQVGETVSVQGRGTKEGATNLVSNMNRSLATFNSIMKRRIPVLAAGSGLSSMVIESSNEDFDGKDPATTRQLKDGPAVRQFVKLRPVKLFTTCTTACKTVVKMTVNVYDRSLERDVWSATLDVPEKSTLHPFDDGDIDGFWSMVTEQLRSSGLL